ncbi:MAG: DUF1223 domain-containing protein [Acidobacteriota bacterium]
MLLLLFVLLGSLTLSAGAAAAESPSGPLVVELFTSQGCSSCPPAERLLAELAKKDSDLLLLSFHVDYWNYLGWEDPFSQAQWSRRQESYAQRLAGGRLYTPQAVLQGQEQCVASRASCLNSAIEELRRPSAVPSDAPPARLEGEVRAQGAEVVVYVEGQLAGPVGPPLELEIVAYENELVTAIQSGENATRTLSHHGVVRALRRSATDNKAPGGSGRFVVPPAWEAAHVGFAALLRDQRSGRILASWDSGPGAALSRSDR